MRMIRWLPAALLTIGSGSIASSAAAHGLDAGRMTIELDDRTVRVVATPRSTTFLEADDDADGLLSLDEVHAHRATLREDVAASLSIVDDRGEAPACGRLDVSTPGSGRPGQVPPSDHIRVTWTCHFEAPPRRIGVRDLRAAAAPVVVDAYRIAMGGVERVVLDDEGGAVLLDRDRDQAPDGRPARDDAARARGRDLAWPGGALAAGAALLGFTSLRRRPGRLTQDPKEHA